MLSVCSRVMPKSAIMVRPERRGLVRLRAAGRSMKANGSSVTRTLLAGRRASGSGSRAASTPRLLATMTSGSGACMSGAVSWPLLASDVNGTLQSTVGPSQRALFSWRASGSGSRAARTPRLLATMTSGSGARISGADNWSLLASDVNGTLQRAVGPMEANRRDESKLLAVGLVDRDMSVRKVNKLNRGGGCGRTYTFADIRQRVGAANRTWPMSVDGGIPDKSATPGSAAFDP